MSGRTPPLSTLPVRALPDDEAPSHRPLAEGWSLWRVVEVRSTGFAAERLLPFVSARCTTTADDAVAARQRERDARAAFLDAARALREVPLDEGARRAVARAVPKVRRGMPVSADGLPDALAPFAAETQQASDAAAVKRSLLAASLDEEHPTWASAVHDVIRAEDFRRALAWQNPSALAGTLAAVLRRPVSDTASQTRKAHLLALSYLQRYATKNDTVGFFGPVGWASLDDEGPALRMHPGRGLVASSSVQLEPWAALALGKALLTDETLVPFLAPTLPPALRLQGGAVSGVGRSLMAVRELDALERALIERVDGRASGVAIAEAVAAGGAVVREEALARLLALWRQGLVRFSLPVQISDAPEAALVDALEKMPAVPQVEVARGRARALLEATDGLRRSLEDAPALEEAVALANERFQTVTGVAPDRRAGEMYACRTPFLLNCRRDLSLTFGSDVTERLAPVLSPVLRAARWFTYEAARGFQALLHDLVESRRRGRDAVPLVEVYRALVPSFARGRPAFLTQLGEEVRRRLTSAIGPLEKRRVDLEAATFAERMAALFDAPQPGWPSARHHSPDVLLAADDEDAFRDGRFTPVLGEVHAGINTLAVLQAVTQHPRPGVLAALQRRDIPPLVVEVQHDSYALCAQDSLLGDDDVHLDTGAAWRSWLPRPPLRLGDVDVLVEDGFLRAVDRRTGVRCELLQVLERVLKLNATTELRLFTNGAHRPRVVVDGAVLQREGWELPREAFAALAESRGADRFLAARQLRRDHDLPDMVFARVPNEPKPVFVDLRAPLSVDVLARVCRQATRLSLSEMLPSLDDLWLRDDAAGRYVAELRMVAVDPIPYRPIPLSP